MRMAMEPNKKKQTPSSQEEPILLGRTDLSITPMGIGTWAWGDKLLWNYGRGYGEQDIVDAFRTSVMAGINLFDTAEVYGSGMSERLLGRLRDSAPHPLVITTKFFPYPWRLGKRALRRALLGSLGRLKMEKVDLYLIHWPFPPVSIKTWMEALADAFDAGLTKAVGVSNYSVDQMQRAQNALMKYDIPLACNQVPFSLLQPKGKRETLLETCADLGVTLVAYSPLAQGLLTGKYSAANPPQGVRGIRTNRDSLQKIERLIHLMHEIGQDHDNAQPGQIAINWVLCKGAVPIPGVKNARQTEENLGALGWRLSQGEVEALEEAAQSLMN
jgi:aryl-alcohol dehydrogenase-like predicted oxidoreductase